MRYLSLFLSLFAGQHSLGVQFMTSQRSSFCIDATRNDPTDNNSINWQAQDTTAFQSNVFGTKINRPIGKIHPITDHEGTEMQYRYASTLSLTSTLGGGR
jgi:hypothetical protein